MHRLRRHPLSGRAALVRPGSTTCRGFRDRSSVGCSSLRADALDFLGDAANHGLALAVIGLALHWRAKAALLKGSVMGMFGFAKAPAALVGPLRGPEAVKPFVAMPGQPIDPPAGVWSPLEIGNYIGSAAGELCILF